MVSFLDAKTRCGHAWGAVKKKHMQAVEWAACWRRHWNHESDIPSIQDMTPEDPTAWHCKTQLCDDTTSWGKQRRSFGCA